MANLIRQRKTHHYGLGEAARGGFPHERLHQDRCGSKFRTQTQNHERLHQDKADYFFLSGIIHNPKHISFFRENKLPVFLPRLFLTGLMQLTLVYTILKAILITFYDY
ncbi:hypothetical protein [Moorena sp. SIO3H5]|uniref:hypothetical protein n=1 Tax=Moorena sp. SIO3H5 TaxID=2607834 RepID=UPI0013BC1E02|nr:hypothetical protein [Moorena sp. SIO3H5]NEO68022.1 hypothetical protein [Moorena sp. SIO3H5]